MASNNSLDLCKLSISIWKWDSVLYLSGSDIRIICNIYLGFLYNTWNKVNMKIDKNGGIMLLSLVVLSEAKLVILVMLS